jgi:hypothetical protein
LLLLAVPLWLVSTLSRFVSRQMLPVVGSLVFTSSVLSRQQFVKAKFGFEALCPIVDFVYRREGSR